MDRRALLDGLALAARHAGDAILDVRRRGFAVRTKDDRSPVTEADAAAERVILDALASLAPGVPVVAEEEVAAGRVPVLGAMFFLVDPLDAQCSFQIRNLHQRLQFEQANAAISPTRFQASTYPASFRPKIDVLHDGIDTAVLKPNPAARIELGSGLVLGRDDEVIGFVGSFYPYEGLDLLIEAMPALLERRPRLSLLLVGGGPEDARLRAMAAASPARSRWA